MNLSICGIYLLLQHFQIFLIKSGLILILTFLMGYSKCTDIFLMSTIRHCLPLVRSKVKLPRPASIETSGGSSKKEEDFSCSLVKPQSKATLSSSLST